MIESIFDCSVFQVYDLPTTVSYSKIAKPLPDRSWHDGYNSLLQRAYSILESKYLKPYFATRLDLNELYRFHLNTAGFYLGDSDTESLAFIREQLQRDPLFGKDCLVGIDNYLLEISIKFYSNINNIQLFGECIRYINNGGTHTKKLLRTGGVSASRAYGPMEDFIRGTKNFYYKGNLTNWLVGRFRAQSTGVGVYLMDVGREDQSRIRRVLDYNFDDMLRPTIVHDPKVFFYNLLLNYLGSHRQWFEEGTYVNFKGTDVYVNHHSLFEDRDLIKDFINHPEYPNQLPYGMLPDVYFKKPIEKLARTMYGKYRNIYMAKLKTHTIEMRYPKYRQLTTGIDLVNEGVRMEHCVGGLNYLEQLQNGETIFFHLDLEDCKHGATLSMETTSFISETRDTYIGPYGGLWVVDQYFGFDDRDLDDDVVAQAELLKFLGEHFTIAEKPEFTVSVVSERKIDYFNHWTNDVHEPGIQIVSKHKVMANRLTVTEDEHGILDVVLGDIGSPGIPDKSPAFGRGMSNPSFTWVETSITDPRIGYHRHYYLARFKSIRKRQIELLGSVAIWSELDLVSEKHSLRSCRQSILLEAGTCIWSPKPVDTVRGNLPSYWVSIRCNGIEHVDAFKIKAGDSFKFTAKHQAILIFSPIHSSEHTELAYKIRELGVSDGLSQY